MEKKDLILDLLKKKGELVESIIAFEIKSSLPYAKKYLRELEEEKKIIQRIEGNRTYWNLKGGKNGRNSS